MGKIFIIYIPLIILVIYTIYETSIYLKLEYEKAISFYSKRQKKRNNYKVIKKEDVLKNTIKNNITKVINSKNINEQIGYAMLSFNGKNEHIKNTKIYKDRINIGRLHNNDVVINNDTVSRNQCLIVKKGEKFYICNLSNTNKTLLNGMPVDNTMEIKYGDVVEIGEITFRFNDVLIAI